MKDYFFDAKNTKEGKISKYNEIVNVLKKIVSEKDADGNNLYDDYDVCSTGHSLGGALAKLLIFVLAGLDPIDTIPLPITAVTFGAPSIGNREYLRKFRWLELAGSIRHIQVTSFGDLVPLFCGHAGVNLQLYEEKQAKVKYSYFINTTSRTARAFAAMENLNVVHVLTEMKKRLESDINSELISKSIDELYRISGATKTFHRHSRMLSITGNNLSVYAQGMNRTCCLCCFSSKFDVVQSRRSIKTPSK